MIRVDAKELAYDARSALQLLADKPFTGISFSLGRNGALKSEIEYRNGMRWGAVREWYADGKPMVEATWERDVLHGRAREWHANGVLAEDGEYEYGFALWAKEWSEDGTLTKTYTMEEGSDTHRRLLALRAMYAGKAG